MAWHDGIDAAEHDRSTIVGVFLGRSAAAAGNPVRRWWCRHGRVARIPKGAGRGSVKPGEQLDISAAAPS